MEIRQRTWQLVTAAKRLKCTQNTQEDSKLTTYINELCCSGGGSVRITSTTVHIITVIIITSILHNCVLSIVIRTRLTVTMPTGRNQNTWQRWFIYWLLVKQWLITWQQQVHTQVKEVNTSTSRCIHTQVYIQVHTHRRHRGGPSRAMKTSVNPTV